MVDNNDRNEQSPPSGSRFYEIRVQGHLNREWSDWFDGLDLKLLDNGEMILSGDILDQSALMGILNKLHRLSLPLLSVSEAAQEKDGK